MFEIKVVLELKIDRSLVIKNVYINNFKFKEKVFAVSNKF